MFERDEEYLHNMTDERLIGAITSNEKYLIVSEERLAVFVPEAVRRGLVVSAKTLEVFGGKDEN